MKSLELLALAKESGSSPSGSNNTLMFRPSIPWPPLTNFIIQTSADTKNLVTLMSSPSNSIPSNGEQDLSPIKEITLEFDQPLNSESLKKMIQIEVIDLPGIETNQSLWLNGDDFILKIPERKDRNAKAVYILKLKNKISYGKKIMIHMKLSLEENLDDSFHKIIFYTKKPFRITGFGSHGNRILPASVSGTNFSKEQVIECKPSEKNIVVNFSFR
mgnify:CR=1 FL=1